MAYAPFSSSMSHGEAWHFCFPSTKMATRSMGLPPTPVATTLTLPVFGRLKNTAAPRTTAAVPKRRTLLPLFGALPYALITRVSPSSRWMAGVVLIGGRGGGGAGGGVCEGRE